MVAPTTDPAVQQLQRQVAELSSIVKGTTQIDQYLDKKSKDILNTNTFNSLFDLVWNNYWLYTVNFESITGYAVTTGVALSSSLGGVSLTTTGAGSNSQTITKNTSDNYKFGFNKQSRMRSLLTFIQTTAMTGHVTVGTLVGDSYGFSWVNSVLSGVTSLGGVTTTLQMKTPLDTTRNFQLEARFFPAGRVDFYVNGLLEGSITKNIPSAANGVLWEVKLTETAAASKVIAMFSFDYLQKQK